MKLQQVAAFIYAPGETINENNINEGIITGRQNKVRGHIDLYRTIVDLFGLYDDSKFYFGVNGLSDEPTFVIDNRIQDLIVQDINNDKHYLVSLRNNQNVYPINTELDLALLDEVVEFKKLSDLLLNDVQVYEILKRLYK